jgi:hypothetical protein
MRQHSGKASFSWDYAKAKGGNSVNPLVSAAPAATASGGSPTASCIPRQALSGLAASTGSNANANGASATQTNSSPAQTGEGDDDRGGSEWWSGRPTARPTARPTGPWNGEDDDNPNRECKTIILPRPSLTKTQNDMPRDRTSPTVTSRALVVTLPMLDSVPSNQGPLATER